LPAFGQNTHKVVGDKHEEYRDSLENSDYTYVFPLYGEKVRKMGYDLPLPAGIMLGYFGMDQELDISNLHVGISDGELVDISDLVEFESITSNVNVWTIRPDVWLFPFMNVYVIANRFTSKTDVILKEPFSLTVPQVSNDGWGAGFGTSLAYGFGPIWASGNFNFAWSKTPVLLNPTQSFSTSLRVGGVHHFKGRVHSLSYWAGANYIDYIGDNGGTYDMTQLIPDDKPRLEELLGDIQDMLDGLNDHYNEFCDTPGNGPKCAVIDPILEEFKSRLEDKLNGIEPPEELPLNYTFNSSPKVNWNMIVGAQYHFNKRWELRAEAGFLGGRESFLVNLNYRFGMVKKKNV
jgi:hypothetical protein